MIQVRVARTWDVPLRIALTAEIRLEQIETAVEQDQLVAVYNL